MALSEQEEFELLSLERQRAVAAPARQKQLSDYGPQWGEGVAHLIDKAAGKVTDYLAESKAPPELAAAAGTAVGVGAPFLLGGAVGGSVGKPVMEAGAKFVMQSAVKPTSKSLVNGEAAQAIDTMLNEGINATAGGAAKLRLMINDLKAQVGRVISQSPAEVNRGYAYRELAKTLEQVTEKASGYKVDRAAVMKAWEEFKNHPLLDKFAEIGDMIPIQLADKVKRASQKAAETSYSALTPPTAADKAQMAIASGLRKGMEEAEPAVGAMNAKLSEYINALQQIEPRAAAAANRDLGGLVPLSHSPEAAMIMLADRNPWMKSLIARVLFQSRTALPAGVGAATAGVASDTQPR